MTVDELKFDAHGLVPAIVVDDESGRVLTLAYMNRESLAISLEKGLTCFWSRSRQELWLKGETSGNYQHIVSITADCDGNQRQLPAHRLHHRRLRRRCFGGAGEEGRPGLPSGHGFLL